MTKALATNSLVAQILPGLVVMSIKRKLITKIKPTSAVSHAVSCAVAHPASSGKVSPSLAIEATIQTILDYLPATDSISEALFKTVNKLAQDAEEAKKQLNATRQAREETKSVSIKHPSAKSTSDRVNILPSK